MPIPIEVLVSDDILGDEEFYQALSVKAVNKTCDVLGVDINEELSIAIVDEKQIQDLNKNYRNKDKPTNVLSFPMEGNFLLGDIVIAPDYIRREAAEQGKNFEDHLTHLIIHGFLHLFGYDHMDDESAAEMEAIEISALAQLSIDNPYELKDLT